MKGGGAARLAALAGTALVASMPLLGCRPRPAPTEEGPAAAASGAAWEAARCERVADFAEPWVLGAPETFSRELTAALSRPNAGVVVVAHDCAGLRVLPRCRAPGAYRRATRRLERRTLELAHPRAVALNLPLARPPAGASRAKVEVTAAMTERTLATVLLRGDLTGDCTGATHGVRGLQRGAYSLAWGDAGAERHGQPETCTPGGDALPGPACAVPLRLELAPIVDDEKSFDRARLLASGRVSEPCPRGLASSGGLCAPPPPGAKACEPGRVGDCEAACARDDPRGCVAFAFSVAVGVEGAPPAPERAEELLVRACELGSAHGCAEAARLLGRGPAAHRDSARLQELEQRACRMDAGAGCYELAYRYYQLRVDPAAGRQARRWAERSCAGGSATGCNALGYLLAEGRGGDAAPARALTLFREACAARDAAACDSVGEALERGWGTAPDREGARAYYELACTRGVEVACANGRRLGAAPGALSAPPAGSIR